MRIHNVIKKVNFLFLLKTGIGSAVSILLADGLGLLYSPSAGIITLLTIQNTKKETLLIALKRFEAFVLAVTITYILFQSIGYTPIAFGLFVCIFVALCMLFRLKDGIAMNSVLMTHFLIEKRMDLPLLWNELAILAIGMSLGIILNLIMPRNIKKIRAEQVALENEIKKALRDLTDMLKKKDACLIQKDRITDENNPDTKEHFTGEIPNEITDSTFGVFTDEEVLSIPDFSHLDEMLEKLLKSAYEEAANTFQNDTRYLISYLEMRKLQIGVLKEVQTNIESIPVILQQTYPMAGFIENIAESFHERNNVKGLLLELEQLKGYFRKEQLPQTREEFEYRAVLFQILKELEYFLKLKRNFVLELEEKNMISYWQ